MKNRIFPLRIGLTCQRSPPRGARAQSCRLPGGWQQLRCLAYDRSVPSDETLRCLQEEAWIGDAVLTLFARSRILDAGGGLDAALASRMTSNQFLSAFGEPTEVEARLGRIYRQQGLAVAFQWIETEWMPLFSRQEDKRQRGSRDLAKVGRKRESTIG